jgi:hypothetical protein
MSEKLALENEVRDKVIIGYKKKEIKNLFNLSDYEVKCIWKRLSIINNKLTYEKRKNYSAKTCTDLFLKKHNVLQINSKTKIKISTIVKYLMNSGVSYSDIMPQKMRKLAKDIKSNPNNLDNFCSFFDITSEEGLLWLKVEENAARRK